MTFTFNSAIPAAPNNPSVDQPDMLTNNISTDAILAVDHISFNTANGGQHKQVTFNNKNVPGAQTDPQSVLYTNSGTASSVSQVFYRNQNVIYYMSAIKAWGLITGAGAIDTSQSHNISAVVRNSAGKYSITLTANAVSSNKFGILLTAHKTGIDAAAFLLIANYTITGSGTFDVAIGSSSSFTDPTNFTVTVYQI